MLNLSELHDLIANVWLTRHDAELEAERAARRKGRPKSTKEQKLEETKLREAEEYRTGMGEIAILSSLRRFSPRGFFAAASRETNWNDQLSHKFERFCCFSLARRHLF